MDLDTVVEENKRLIYSIISRFYPYYDRDDLFQVGMLGLLKAYQNYDSSYENKFTTYAHTYIFGEVLKFVREDKNIKASKELISVSKKVDKAREILTQKLMRTPNNIEISLFLEIPEEIIDEVEQYKNFVLSLDMALNAEEEGKEVNLYDAVPFEEKGYNETILDLRVELEQLSEPEKKLIWYRYFADRTQSETSKELGMSQVQVSRNENKILTKLQQKLSA